MSNSFGPLEEADFNQSPPFVDVNLFALDRPLREATAAFGTDQMALSEFGAGWGSAARFEAARLANEFPPRLKSVDPTGRRIDRVEFHPAYHELMALSMRDGLHGSVWDAAPEPAAAVTRAARLYMASGVEAGHICPITMTNAAVASLKADAALFAKLAPKLRSRVYDPRPLPWWEKHSMTFGMGMTERQGGTDVRANVTAAKPAGDHAEITGHKWFMSAPMCDAFLVLAQGDGGLGCFVVPRFRPDGSANLLRFNRLKPKLGNHSNASSEVEFLGAYAMPLGEPGAGVRTIIGMVTWTRLDCAVSSAGLMRMGLAHALHHASHRSVFQKRLIDQPLMRAVLADMALELEGLVAAVFRLAHAFDAMASDPAEAAYVRLMTPVIKYLSCKRAPAFLYEALECHGGNGYVEELPLARYYREAPLNAIWEGSGNVMALDLLRAASRQRDETRSVITRLVESASVSFDTSAAVAEIERLLQPSAGEQGARRLIELLGKLGAVSALAELNSTFAGLYAQSRIGGAPAQQFGATLLSAADQAQLLMRAFPA